MLPQVSSYQSLPDTSRPNSAGANSQLPSDRQKNLQQALLLQMEMQKKLHEQLEVLIVFSHIGDSLHYS